jgi:hypothetical protein
MQNTTENMRNTYGQNAEQIRNIYGTNTEQIQNTCNIRKNTQTIRTIPKILINTYMENIQNNDGTYTEQIRKELCHEYLIYLLHWQTYLFIIVRID